MVYGGPATSAADANAPHSKGLTYRVVAVRKGAASDPPGERPLAGHLCRQHPRPAGAGSPSERCGDPEQPDVPGTNIVTGKESPKPAVGLNKNFGKAIAPIVKSAPAGTAFRGDASLQRNVPPEQFEAAFGRRPLVVDTSGR